LFTILGELVTARAKVSLKNNCEKDKDFQKNLGYLGISRTFWGYLEFFGGIFREKIENFRIYF